MNDKLPSFSLEATKVSTCGDGDLQGKWAVLFIYPKDNTSGCTREAREFNERYSEFESAGLRVFGISKDTMASHTSFSKKLNLQFPLISDPQTQLIQSLNAWKEKSMYGKKYMGAERSTFLINENLTVKYIWRKVKVAGHVDEVFNKYQELISDL
ncbi:peroxiredoxin [Paracoccaceae bacterium]|nr:peroxiredoxin [Paracoccaceae bacterium]